MIWDEINDYIDDKRIVFAYIPYYRCLYDVNLNFDTEFSIEYDKVSKHLSIRRNDTFPKNFWPGNISSVSVIAGKNGAGKSSVIQWLMERTFFGGMPERINGIIVLYENQELLIYHDIEVKISYDGAEKTKIRINSKDTSNWPREILRSNISIRTLFYSGHFNCKIQDRRLLDEDDMVWNLSDQWLLEYDFKENNDSSLSDISIGDFFNAHEVKNDIRICNLLFDRRFEETFKENGHLEIRLPRYIVFSAKTNVDRVLDNRIQLLKDSQIIENGQKKKKKKYPKSDINSLRGISEVSHNPTMEMRDEAEGKAGFSKFLYYALKDFCFKIMPQKSFNGVLKSEILDLFTNDYVHSELSVTEWIKNAKSKIESKIGGINLEISKNDIIQVRDFFESLEISMGFIEKLKWKDGSPYIDCVSTVNDPNFHHSHGEQAYAEHLPAHYRNIDEVISRVERFCNIRYSHSLIQESILSSGELAMLNLYSRIKYALDHQSYKKYKESSCILLLDEAEIGFHPEWQRQFVNKLTYFVSKISEGCAPIQIIYTTHSPITLSDMPKECVNLLKIEKNESRNVPLKEKRETFGANVFELYGDSFFMENGLIGEFASEKIKALNKEIECVVSGDKGNDDPTVAHHRLSDKEYLDSLRIRINMIGDKRIKSYLSSRLNIADSNEEIRRLKEYIANLESSIQGNHEKD